MKIRRTITGIAWSMATVLLLAGCNKEIPDAPGRTDGKARISFPAPIIAEEAAAPQTASDKQPATRAAEQLTKNTTVRVVAFTKINPTYKGDQAYFVDGDGKLKPCTVNADGSFKAVDTQNELALYPDTYDFYAYTPALPLNANKSTVTVPNGVDYASSVTANINVTNDRTLTLTTLDRKASKIALVVKKGTDNTLMTALSVAAGGVAINNLAPTVTTTGLNPTISQASGSATLTVPQSAFKTVSTTEASAITYLLPRLGTDRMKIDYNLTYTVSGSSETKTVSGSMGNTALEPGKSYTFTLTMRQAGASLAVTEWIDGGSQDVVTGESLDYTDNGKGWFYLTGGNLRNPSLDVTDPTKMSWYEANEIANVSNPNPFKVCPAGWRMPSKNEMHMMWIYKGCFTESSISLLSGIYWVSTPSLGDANAAWYVDVSTGIAAGISKATPQNVRCIRPTVSGKRYPYVDVNADGRKSVIISRDTEGGVGNKGVLNSSELTVLNTKPLVAYNELSPYNKVSPIFEVAQSNAAAGVTWTDWMNRGTGNDGSGCPSGWRMPNQREMILIMSMALETELTGVNTIVAGDAVSYYMNSTYTSRNPANVWTISSNLGHVNLNMPTTTTFSYVRCIRDVGISVAQSTVMADYAQWGNSFTTNVAFNSIDGAVTVKSIDNTSSDKNWVTSAIVSGTTSGNVAITYAPTSGNAGVHNDVTITLVNQGGATQAITVKYDNGLLPQSALSSNGWTTGLPTKGIQIAKIGNKLPFDTADTNPSLLELVVWGNAMSVPGAQQTGVGKGKTNTDAIIALLPTTETAAKKCRSLGTDWYLSSLDELATIQKIQKTYLGPSYLFEGSAYWSSSEVSSSTTSVWMVSMNNIGAQSQGTKTSQSRIRCVRDVQ